MVNAAILQANLLSPVVLAFFMGLFAAVLKSDLRFPDSFFAGLSAYLLLAIGLKGGAALNQVQFMMLINPIGATLLMSMFLPSCAFFVCRFFGKLKQDDAAAIAAHYGSVSIVTFIATKVFLETQSLTVDDYMTGLVAIMEIPGIILALLLAQGVFKRKSVKGIGLFERLRGIFLSKSIYLLWGGLLIGMISGQAGVAKVSPFFVDPFYGVLVLFMLEMGLLAGSRLYDLKKVGGFLILFSILMPLVSGTIAIVVSNLVGFSMANAVLFAAMSASASYIAAPAAVRVSLPFANPAYYLTSALVLTFPFNLTIGIPIYYLLACWWYNL
jgi:hypothetical protein